MVTDVPYRSFDPNLFRKATESCRDSVPESVAEEWVDDHRNVMLVDGEDVGLATYEYPGLYNVHWFFTSRGRAAINQARNLLDHLFTNYPARVIRGITPVSLRAARWAGRQVGMTSYGVVTYPHGDHEIFLMTKDEFYAKGTK